MTKQITVHFDICYVPLPAEKRFAYNEAHRLLHELMLKAWLARKPEESLPAEDGSPDEGRHADLPQLEAPPGAGVTTPPDSPFAAPAGVTSSPLQAQTTTGNAG
jgi:hypothetical protein